HPAQDAHRLDEAILACDRAHDVVVVERLRQVTVGWPIRRRESRRWRRDQVRVRQSLLDPCEVAVYAHDDLQVLDPGAHRLAVEPQEKRKTPTQPSDGEPGNASPSTRSNHEPMIAAPNREMLSAPEHPRQNQADEVLPRFSRPPRPDVTEATRESGHFVRLFE